LFRFIVNTHRIQQLFSDGMRGRIADIYMKMEPDIHDGIHNTSLAQSLCADLRNQDTYESPLMYSCENSQNPFDIFHSKRSEVAHNYSRHTCSNGFLEAFSGHMFLCQTSIKLTFSTPHKRTHVLL